MSDGPFTDDDAKQWMLAVQTQAGIRKYAEAMAQVLAEAGRASKKVTGDSPRTAVQRWSNIIRDRAFQLLEEDPLSPMQKQMREMRERFQNTVADARLLPPRLRDEN